MNRLLATLITLSLATSACITTFPPRPDLAWDESPEVAVIKAYSVGGYEIHTYYYENYIPEVRMLGDGRIIWVEHHGSRRRVLEGQLTHTEMLSILKRFYTAGFFDWKYYYHPEGVSDSFHANTRTLEVNLLSSSKSVSDLFESAPADYNSLWEFVTSGTGVEGVPYQPTTGYLQAKLFEESYSGPAFVWPDEEAGFSLANVMSGRYVDGVALAHAWQILSEDQVALVISNNKVYNIALRILGLSYLPPP